ncbi:hypothetical protein LZ31DRAFT_217134 [Colletotrichum somersetense]|nr:hypothetical protein LZ31DRAFT_217134 [Colletotrichum somersetense]
MTTAASECRGQTGGANTDGLHLQHFTFFCPNTRSKGFGRLSLCNHQHQEARASSSFYFLFFNLGVGNKKKRAYGYCIERTDGRTGRKANPFRTGRNHRGHLLRDLIFFLFLVHLVFYFFPLFYFSLDPCQRTRLRRYVLARLGKPVQNRVF